MKKRIISALLTSALILSMTACGADTETPESTTTDSAEATTTTTAAIDEDTAEAITTTAPKETEETTTTTEAPPVESAKIRTFSGLNNGYMAFTADDDMSYLYNITEKTFTEIDGKYCTFEYDDGSIFSTQINGDIAYIVTDIILDYGNGGGNKCYGAAIKLSTGEVILKNDEDSDTFYTNYYSRSTGDMLFIKTEESFEGNTFKFGVMDSNGNWKNDFSESEVFLKDVDYYQNIFGENVLMYNVDEDFNHSYYIYSLKDKTKTPFNLPEGNLIGSSYAVGDMLLITPWTFDGYYTPSEKWYIMNAKGEMTTFEHNPLSFEKYGIVTKDNKILDSDTLEVKYDFSEYESLDDITIASPEERYAERLTNPNGDRYIGIFDMNKNKIIEPFKIEFSENGSFDNAGFSGDYFVAYNSTEGNVIANCATGEVKTYEKTIDDLGYYIEAFDEELGLMVVKSDEYYYLVDPADPETLINPFEITE